MNFIPIIFALFLISFIKAIDGTATTPGSTADSMALDDSADSMAFDSSDDAMVIEAKTENVKLLITSVNNLRGYPLPILNFPILENSHEAIRKFLDELSKVGQKCNKLLRALSIDEVRGFVRELINEGIDIGLETKIACIDTESWLINEYDLSKAILIDAINACNAIIFTIKHLAMVNLTEVEIMTKTIEEIEIAAGKKIDELTEQEIECFIRDREERRALTGEESELTVEVIEKMKLLRGGKSEAIEHIVKENYDKLVVSILRTLL